MSHSRILQALATVLMVSAAQHATAGESLPPLDVDLTQTTVSGLSSGAYMAGQFHIAFSAEVTGVGIVAGGPYGCAEGRIELALKRCMATDLGEPDPAALFTAAAKLAATGAIDPLSDLADDRVYVFTGTADHTVLPAVGAKIPPFYALAGLSGDRCGWRLGCPPATASPPRTAR